MATGHNSKDGDELVHSPGWQTLLTILRESGESPEKRSFDSFLSFHGNSNVGGKGVGESSLPSRSDDVRLAKRLRRISLSEK